MSLSQPSFKCWIEAGKSKEISRDQTSITKLFSKDGSLVVSTICANYTCEDLAVKPLLSVPPKHAGGVPRSIKRNCFAQK